MGAEPVGVIPAAGYATRLQPLRCSKEVYPIHGRAVIDYLVERMRRAGCSELRIVTRPEKRDVIRHAHRLGAIVVDGAPRTLAASLALGMNGLDDDTVVLFGFPDSIWEPVDGFRRLASRIERGSDVALGLFRTRFVDRPDVVSLDGTGTPVRIEVDSPAPPPNLIWGCAAARARALLGLESEEDPGVYLDSLLTRAAVAGVFLSDRYVDIGTRHGLSAARASCACDGPRGSASGRR